MATAPRIAESAVPPVRPYIRHTRAHARGAHAPHPPQVQGQPGAGPRSTRGGSEVNPGRVRGQPGAGRGKGRGRGGAGGLGARPPTALAGRRASASPLRVPSVPQPCHSRRSPTGASAGVERPALPRCRASHPAERCGGEEPPHAGGPLDGKGASVLLSLHFILKGQDSYGISAWITLRD